MMVKISTKRAEGLDEVRCEAGKRLKSGKGARSLPVDGADTQRLAHELEVHQVELEIQNVELLQTRDGLEKALERYTDLYDFAPVGYFSFGRDGAIHSANHCGASILGCNRSSLIGRFFEKFVAAPDRALFADMINKVFAGSCRERCEVELSSVGAHPLFVQIEAETDSAGQISRAVVIDISERRRLSEQLTAHAADLSAANIELEAFNYTVSHDLRLPLTTINGFCQLLQTIGKSQLNEECQGFISNIYKATKEMNQLIATLLEFSKASRDEVRRDPIDLSRITTEVCRGLALTEPERNVSFLIADQMGATGDGGLLRVVLANLLDNAWKHTRDRQEAVIEFGKIEKEGEVPVYFVRDNGSGFDMAGAGKIFSPFARLPGTNLEGHGIGLATVARIIHRHGGRIWPEAVAGRGATFYFTLCADACSSASIDFPPDPSPHRTHFPPG